MDLELDDDRRRVIEFATEKRLTSDRPRPTIAEINLWNVDGVYREAARRKAEWQAKHPSEPEQFIEPNSHPFSQAGPFIKVALYNQWADNSAAAGGVGRRNTWEDARIGTIYGLRFGQRGFGLTFHKGHWLPHGLVSFGAVSQAHKDDGRTV